MRGWGNAGSSGSFTGWDSNLVSRVSALELRMGHTMPVPLSPIAVTVYGEGHPFGHSHVGAECPLCLASC